MEYTIVLDQKELQVIFAALGELPLKVGINVVEKLRDAVNTQSAAAAKAAEAQEE